ncbi:monooxygenase [Karstenula rhodostoma CBS 690.94]|uniref:Monooxygenase n=1 Tax=Karstenula rhodostoma CBS 690.94 TaxID=1392251 RepID=A0A9P4UAH1_9PLEO|nr:monooxygenase [Karstenula rhodostoma CBS 690.94]
MEHDKIWTKEAMDSGQGYTDTSVVIVGAGIGGICVAIDLITRNHCRDFVILEQSSGIGGTWHDNTYPGCAVDLQAVVYSYSFAPNSHWTRDFPGQKEILSYLTRVAQEYRLYEHIRFCSAAEEATWDDELKKWKTTVRVAKGSKEAESSSSYILSSDFFVSAVGQLSQPSYPEIHGRDGFLGKTMHSARWDWTYDLKDKKIAVIGSGCSAVQIVPELAKVANKVSVFQRTPHWMVPRGDVDIPEWKKALYRHFPSAQRYWRKYYITANEGDFSSNNFSETEENAQLKQVALNMMREQLPDRPDLWEKLTPEYPLGCKRLVVSDFFYPALGLPNVELEARRIHDFTPQTIRVVGTDGHSEEVEPQFDLVVYATGFRANDFLHPMKIYGRNGRALHEVWKESAEAYLGICADDMPNFGIVLGPNTGLLHNSFILMIEAQSRYISGLIKPVLESRHLGGTLSLRPRTEIIKAYNLRLQSLLKGFSVSDTRCTNWYKTSSGKVTNLWPGLVLEYQQLVEQVNYEDYEAEGSLKRIVQDRTSHKVGRVVEEAGVLQKLSFTALIVLSISAVVGGSVAHRIITRL